MGIASTEEGQVILDPFCGSGITGGSLGVVNCSKALSVSNTYATLIYINPLFMGFSRHQNIPKEIIKANIEKEQQTPEIRYFRGGSFYSENLSDPLKTHENVPATNR